MTKRRLCSSVASFPREISVACWISTNFKYCHLLFPRRVLFPSSPWPNVAHAHPAAICFIRGPTKRWLAARKQTRSPLCALSAPLGRPFPVIAAPLKGWQLPGPGVIPSTLPAHNVYPGRLTGRGLLKEVLSHHTHRSVNRNRLENQAAAAVGLRRLKMCLASQFAEFGDGCVGRILRLSPVKVWRGLVGAKKKRWWKD